MGLLRLKKDRDDGRDDTDRGNDPVPYRILIADDDADIHRMTRTVLRDFRFEGRGLEFFDAYTGEEVLRILKKHTDIALVLLDVSMEEEDSGLQVVEKIRLELKNTKVRIVLRTGRPEQAPEKEVIELYDINDYRDKTELNASKLFTLFYASLRAYRDILELDREKKKLEVLNLELDDYNRNLQDLVKKELEKELNLERQLIQQSRLAEMGEMINVIAHQWKQPLSALALSVEDLLDAFEYGEMDGDYLRNSSQQMLEAISYMNTTIDDFRDYFKPSREQGIFEVETAIRQVIKLLFPNLLRHSIEVNVDNYCSDPTVARGYVNDFKQVIFNLLSNARDALLERQSQGESDYKAAIKIKIFPTDDGETGISVCDNGIGIPDNLMQKIFQPYITTKGEKGTGIGLQISRMIIESNMKGRIYAKNRPTGAEFIIELPQVKEENFQ